MFRFGLLLALVVTAAAEDHAEKTEVTFLNLKGLLIPDTSKGAATRTFTFRTEEEDVVEVDIIVFRCGRLDEVFTADETSGEAKKPVILCSGEVPQSVQGMNNKLVFLFSSEGLEFAPEEREINLLLGSKAISNLQQVTAKVIDDEIERAKRQIDAPVEARYSREDRSVDAPVHAAHIAKACKQIDASVDGPHIARAKRQFGFGASGANAGASSFGGGFGGGGFPGGYGGGFSGSAANAGAGSIGGGFGR